MNYVSQILWVLKTRGVRWIGKFSRIGQKVMHREICWGTLRERDRLKGLGKDGMMLLKCVCVCVCVCETNRTEGRGLDSSG
jgi:hypothetical protein